MQVGAGDAAWVSLSEQLQTRWMNIRMVLSFNSSQRRREVCHTPRHNVLVCVQFHSHEIARLPAPITWKQYHRPTSPASCRLQRLSWRWLIHGSCSRSGQVSVTQFQGETEEPKHQWNLVKWHMQPASPWCMGKQVCPTAAMRSINSLQTASCQLRLNLLAAAPQIKIQANLSCFRRDDQLVFVSSVNFAAQILFYANHGRKNVLYHILGN